MKCTLHLFLTPAQGYLGNLWIFDSKFSIQKKEKKDKKMHYTLWFLGLLQETNFFVWVLYHYLTQSFNF